MSTSDDVEEIKTQGQVVLAHVRENSVPYMIGLLVLQQMGWLGELLAKAQGMCY